VALSALQLKIVRGTGQMVTVGQVFEPVVLRVTDSSPAPNPVQGAGVTFIFCAAAACGPAHRLRRRIEQRPTCHAGDTELITTWWRQIQVDWRAWCHRLVRVRERCRSKWLPAPEPPPHSNSPLCLCGRCPRRPWEGPHQCHRLRECRHFRLDDRTVEIQIFQSAV